MIIDKIVNSHLYSCLSKGIVKALDYIRTTDFSTIEPGKYEIEGSKIYALVSIYGTKDAETTKPEGHIKYIDVQYIATGEELIGYAPFNNQIPTVEYDPEKDIRFFKEDMSFTKLEAGMFAIFFPTDLHQPCIKTDKPSTVKKVVVKVIA